MSTPERPGSSYYCRQCGTTGTDSSRCSQCQSETLEEVPAAVGENEQDFEQLFNSNFDIQSFASLLLPMLMSQAQTYPPPPPVPAPARHRRARQPRRIKRAAQTHRHTTAVDVMSLPTSQIRFFPLDDFLPRQILQPNVTLVQVPLQLWVFDPQRDHFNPELFAQLLNEETEAVPLTRDDIDQLTPISMTSSNLSLFPSCAICLESFEPSSDVKQLPACHHVFHTTCLTEWLLRHGNCPMCRSVISSRHRTPVNDPWMQQLIFRTLGPSQEPMNRIVVYPPIKAMSLPQIASNTLTATQTRVSSTETPQLPHFDSQTQVQQTPSTTSPEDDTIAHRDEKM